MTEKSDDFHFHEIQGDKTLPSVEQRSYLHGRLNGSVGTSGDHAGLDEDNLPDYHDHEIKRLIRKIDLRLLPPLALFYLLSFLNRSNIANAKIAGMTKDLNMKGHDYNIALTTFFIPYAVFMVPSNIVIKKIRPSWWITCLMICWGIVMTMHGMVESYGQLCAVRSLLGLFESGFLPAADYLLTCWYARYELQTRTSLFLAAGTLASAFSGLLAYAIEHMDGAKAGWRWIFILEGIATVIVGCTVWYIMPDSPELCSFLTPREKIIIERRIAHDAGTIDGHVEMHDSFDWKLLRETLLDWRVWLWGLTICGESLPAYAFGFFAPTIVQELGYQTWEAQLLVAPVYIVAAVVSIATALCADMRRRRWTFIVYPYFVSMVGLVAMLAIPHPRFPGVTYAFLFLIPAGVTCGRVGVLTWTGNNLAPSFRRAIGVAFVATLGNVGGAIGSNIYLEEQAPRYWLGFGFSLGTIIAAVISAVTIKTALSRINEGRNRVDVADVKRRYTQEELNKLGDRSLLYRYVI